MAVALCSDPASRIHPEPETLEIDHFDLPPDSILLLLVFIKTCDANSLVISDDGSPAPSSDEQRSAAVAAAGPIRRRSSALFSVARRGFKEEKLGIAELGILVGIDWRVRSITPFSFAHFFFDTGRPPRGLKIRRFGQIVYGSQGDIRFTTFKPSVISASALLVAFYNLYPRRYRLYEDRLKNLGYLDKKKLDQFVALMKEICAKKRIRMETAEIEVYEDPCMRVESGETSGEKLGTRSKKHR